MIIDNVISIDRNYKSQALYHATVQTFVAHYREKNSTFLTFGFITEYYFMKGK